MRIRSALQHLCLIAIALVVAGAAFAQTAVPAPTITDPILLVVTQILTVLGVPFLVGAVTLFWPVIKFAYHKAQGAKADAVTKQTTAAAAQASQSKSALASLIAGVEHGVGYVIARKAGEQVHVNLSNNDIDDIVGFLKNFHAADILHLGFEGDKLRMLVQAVMGKTVAVNSAPANAVSPSASLLPKVA